jgi:hypothetical protein
MDIKLALACEVCSRLGYELFPGRCDECNFPLLKKKAGGAWFVGCWFCADRRERASSCKDALHKARAAQVGIILERESHRPSDSFEPGLGGREMYGSPL